MYRHQLGDIVRLNAGWTPMTVIGFTPDDEVIAQYGTCLTDEDVRNPEYARSTYVRPHHRFTQWDGKDQYTKFPKGIKNMARRFQIIGSQTIGTFLQMSNFQLHVLEFDDGTVGAFDSSQIVELVPKTFAVRHVNGNNYKTHFECPSNVQINKNDLLYSHDGNMYAVVDPDSKHPGKVTQFMGQRIQLSPL